MPKLGDCKRRRELNAFRRLLHALVPLLLLTAAGCAAIGFGERSRQPADLRGAIQYAQEKVFPALVFIKPITEQLGSGELLRQRVFGSGAIISPDGLVVTNSHVARDAKEIACVLSTREQLAARVVGYDEQIDLALLQLKLPDGHAPLPTVSFGDSDTLREGEFVLALGSPFGFTRSISFGIVSSSRRYLASGYYHLWIQTDAAINPGNSGGPLVNDRGQVVGINTLRTRYGDNIGFAIPANTVKDIIERIRDHGRVIRSYTGITFQPVRDFVNDTILDYDSGVLIAGVDAASPAANAGLKAGDLVLECNQRKLCGLYLEDLPEIRNYFAFLPADKELILRVRRDDNISTVSLSPSDKPARTGEGIVLERWNCSVQEVNQFRTPGLAYFVPGGVYVLGVRRPGNAYDSGLRRGDIILKVNTRPVQSLEAMRNIYLELTRSEDGERTALIEVLRQAYSHSIVLDFSRDRNALN